MVLHRKKFVKKTYKSAPKRKYVPKKKPSIKAVKTIVKREIARNVENKTYQYYTDAYNVYPSNHASFNTSFFPCHPAASYLQIDQGTGEGNRVGNKIVIRKLSIKGTLVAAAYDVTANPTPAPTVVVMRFFRVRATPSTLPASMNGFIQQGNTQLNLQNRLSDVWQSYNQDGYKCFCRRIFKIGNSSDGGAGSMWGNNDFKINQNFNVDLTKYVMKHWRFNDTSTTPVCPGIFCSIQAIRADDTNFAATAIPVHASWALNIEYEDA